MHRHHPAEVEMASTPVALRPPHPLPKAGHCGVASSFFCFERDLHGLSHSFQRAKLLRHLNQRVKYGIWEHDVDQRARVHVFSRRDDSSGGTEERDRDPDPVLHEERRSNGRLPDLPGGGGGSKGPGGILLHARLTQNGGEDGDAACGTGAPDESRTSALLGASQLPGAGSGHGFMDGFSAQGHESPRSTRTCAPPMGTAGSRNWRSRYQIRTNRFAPNEPGHPIENVNPFIVRDFSRCILCGRCVQACNEVQVNNAISFGYRGKHSKIVAKGDRALKDSDCVFCGECVQACPVGALVTKQDC